MSPGFWHGTTTPFQICFARWRCFGANPAPAVEFIIGCVRCGRPRNCRRADMEPSPHQHRVRCRPVQGAGYRCRAKDDRHCRAVGAARHCSSTGGDPRCDLAGDNSRFGARSAVHSRPNHSPHSRGNSVHRDLGNDSHCFPRRMRRVTMGSIEEEVSISWGSLSALSRWAAVKESDPCAWPASRKSLFPHSSQSTFGDYHVIIEAAIWHCACTLGHEKWMRSNVAHGRCCIGSRILDRRKKRLIAPAFPPIRTATERWPSGRRRSPAKGVYLIRVSRVRIPSSPPFSQNAVIYPATHSAPAGAISSIRRVSTDRRIYEGGILERPFGIEVSRITENGMAYRIGNRAPA